MEPVLLAVLVGVPLAWHLAMAAYVFYDARRQGMDRRKWTAVAVCVPFFGFFAYVFERDERNREPDPEFFTEGPFEIHESRADDASLFSRRGASSDHGDGEGGGEGNGDGAPNDRE